MTTHPDIPGLEIPEGFTVGPVLMAPDHDAFVVHMSFRYDGWGPTYAWFHVSEDVWYAASVALRDSIFLDAALSLIREMQMPRVHPKWGYNGKESGLAYRDFTASICWSYQVIIGENSRC